MQATSTRCFSTCPPTRTCNLVEDDCGLNGALVLHCFQTIGPLLQLEGLVDNALDLDLAAICSRDLSATGCHHNDGVPTHTEIVDGSRELVGLAERTENGDLVTKDLAWWPRDTVLVGIDAIHDELATSSDIVDRVLQNLDAAGGFNNDVESVWVLGLQFLELCLWVLTGQLDVFIRSIERLGQVHLETLRSSNNDVAAAVQTQQLSQDETRRSRTEHEHTGTHLGSYLVQTVGSAGSRLEKSGIDVAEVLDLEDSLGWVCAVLSEATVHGDTVCLEVFTEKLLATTTWENSAETLEHAGMVLVVLTAGQVDSKYQKPLLRTRL